MKKKILYKRVLLLVLVALMTCSVTAYAKETTDVKVSEESYKAKIGTVKGFLYNEKPLDAKVGTEMYLTYTVGEEVAVQAHQQGVLGTADPLINYPYQNGGLLYYRNNNTETLLKPGYTYFFKFVVTEDGFEYTAGYAKGKESKYLYLISKAGEGNGQMKHMGIWLDGGATGAELTRIHCYDKDGNDLGVSGVGISVMREYTTPFPKSTINHNYKITVDKQRDVNISNQKKTLSDEIYFEYTVASSESSIYQTGIRLNSAVASTGGQYQYENMPFDKPGNGELLIPGAEYWIRCRNTGTARGWEALIQRTYEGKVEWFQLTRQVGTISEENLGFCSVVFGEGVNYNATFVLEKVKCYDSKGNNLGVKINCAGEIEHAGELMDYSGCDNVYYCKEQNIVIELGEEKVLRKTTADGVTTSGTYVIDDGAPLKLKTKLGKVKEEYIYFRTYLEDAEGNRYNKLSSYTVRFVTGNETDIPMQKLNAESGYLVSEPKEPKQKNDKFLYWHTSDGEKYDFGQIVDSSMTLYAKWENNANREYEKTFIETEDINWEIYIPLFLSFIAVVLTVTICVWLARKEKKHGIRKKEKAD